MVKWFAQVYRRPAIQATVIFPVESRRPRLEAVGVDWSTLVVKEAGFTLRQSHWLLFDNNGTRAICITYSKRYHLRGHHRNHLRRPESAKKMKNPWKHACFQGFLKRMERDSAGYSLTLENKAQTQFLKSGGTKSVTLCNHHENTIEYVLENEELFDVIASWPSIPQNVRETILFLARQCTR